MKIWHVVLAILLIGLGLMALIISVDSLNKASKLPASDKAGLYCFEFDRSTQMPAQTGTKAALCRMLYCGTRHPVSGGPTVLFCNFTQEVTPPAK